MYAVQDMVLTATPVPTAGLGGPPPGQVEPRAVESTEAGTLESEGRDDLIYKSGSPVVQLAEDTVQVYTELLAIAEQAGSSSPGSGASLGASLGVCVDVYA